MNVPRTVSGAGDTAGILFLLSFCQGECSRPRVRLSSVSVGSKVLDPEEIGEHQILFLTTLLLLTSPGTF